jgi:hypothetical protein
MRSRTFLHVSLGILALAAAYHLGAQTVVAQTGSHDIAAVDQTGAWVFTEEGDIYLAGGGGDPRLGYTFVGNVFAGDPTPVQTQSWGSVKARYRGERAPIK